MKDALKLAPVFALMLLCLVELARTVCESLA